MKSENEYPKLVRDKIPEIIKAHGGEASFRTLSDDEYLKYLKKKCVEEAKEIAASDSESGLIEEIADLEEALAALAEHSGFTTKQIKKTQHQKRKDKGAFNLRLLMLDKVDTGAQASPRSDQLQ